MLPNIADTATTQNEMNPLALAEIPAKIFRPREVGTLAAVCLAMVFERPPSSVRHFVQTALAFAHDAISGTRA